jgi:hypothetical protein
MVQAQSIVGIRTGVADGGFGSRVEFTEMTASGRGVVRRQMFVVILLHQHF